MDLGGTPTLLELQQQRKNLASTGLPETTGLPEPVLQHITRQIVTGLRELHSHNLLHRDVKPDNVLVNSKGDARLADFGLSKFLEWDESDKSGYRRTDSFIGTTAYLSPQRSQGRLVSLKEDIWAFGMVLYYLAT